MKPKHHKKRFEKIPAEKQKRILEVATKEFAQNGFPTANINVIARKSGISIGSMYNYFESKEALFLEIIDRGYKIIEEVFEKIESKPADVFEKIEQLLRAAQAYSKQYPELIQIYLDMTSEGLSHLSSKLSGKLETVSAFFFRTLIAESLLPEVRRHRSIL
ncbi:TetR/AcrR family transcriptional regulator [Desulfobacterales bacterium HSG16]|nr:TetR/AcrR family transcriptional regulator [Desulfobacterales bacterium HSG16]